MIPKVKQFAAGHPLAFAFAASGVYLLILIFSAALGALWPGEAYGSPGGALGRTASSAVLLGVLFRLGWLRPAGFTRLGRWQTWLILLLPLAYAVAASAFAFTGKVDFRFSEAGLPGPVVLFIVAAAFLEEAVFRGLILYAFIRAWGSTNGGLLRSVLVSALFFGGMHLLDITSGRPLPDVVLQSLEATFLGIVLGTLVAVGNSIYPAVFFHGVLNLTGYWNLAGAGLGETPAAWLLLSLLMLPLALSGVYLLWRDTRRSIVPGAA